MARLRKKELARWARGGRRITAVSIPAIAVAAAITLALAGGLTGARTAASGATRLTLNRQQFAARILKTQAKVMTSPAQAVLRMQATGSKDMSPGVPTNGIPGQDESAAANSASGGGAPSGPAFTNVRVNDPSLDTHQPDQTTQSETSIAVVGSHIAVGYNDSQQTGLFLTAGSDLAGYSYSADGGAHFTDGGTIPNTPEFVNLSDPWLASTRAGDMYYSDLSYDLFNFNLDVTVAKSADGGKTWATPVPVYRPPFAIFYIGDKRPSPPAPTRWSRRVTTSTPPGTTSPLTPTTGRSSPGCRSLTPPTAARPGIWPTPRGSTSPRLGAAPSSSSSARRRSSTPRTAPSTWWPKSSLSTTRIA